MTNNTDKSIVKRRIIAALLLFEIDQFPHNLLLLVQRWDAAECAGRKSAAKAATFLEGDYSTLRRQSYRDRIHLAIGL